MCSVCERKFIGFVVDCRLCVFFFFIPSIGIIFSFDIVVLLLGERKKDLNESLMYGPFIFI